MADVTASAQYSSIATRLAALEQKLNASDLAVRLYRILAFGAQSPWPPAGDVMSPAFSSNGTLFEGTDGIPDASLYAGVFGVQTDSTRPTIRDYIGSDSSDNGLAARVFSATKTEVVRFSPAYSNKGLAQMLIGSAPASGADPLVKLNSGVDGATRSMWGAIFKDGYDGTSAPSHDGLLGPGLCNAIFGTKENILDSDGDYAGRSLYESIFGDRTSEDTSTGRSFYDSVFGEEDSTFGKSFYEKVFAAPGDDGIQESLESQTFGGIGTSAFLSDSFAKKAFGTSLNAAAIGSGSLYAMIKSLEERVAALEAAA